MSVLSNWNGDHSNLPAEGELFEFRGEAYYWEKCGCSNPFCSRPLGYNKDGEKVRHLTARLRGENQGMPAENILAKFMGVAEYADQLEAGKTAPELWEELLLKVEPDGVLDTAALEAKNINVEDFNEAKEALADMANGVPDLLDILMLIAASRGNDDLN